MGRRAAPWCVMLAAVVLMGPGTALAGCGFMSGPWPWVKPSPDGRFELVHELELSDEGRQSARLTLRNRRTRAVFWAVNTTPPIEWNDALIVQRGSSVLVFWRLGAQLSLWDAEKQIVTWSLDGILMGSEVARLSKHGCPPPLWALPPRMDGEDIVLEVPVGGHLRWYHHDDVRYVTVRISPLGKVTREPVAPIQAPLVLIRQYRAVSSELERLRLADDLWGLSQREPFKRNQELQRFWEQVLSDPETPPSVFPLAVDGLATCAGQPGLRTMARLGPGVLERDAEILDELAYKLPEEAGTYALRALTEPHPSEHVRALALQYLVSEGGTAGEMGRSLLQREPEMKDMDAVLQRVGETGVIRHFSQMVPFCADPSAEVRSRAEQILKVSVSTNTKSVPILLGMPSSAEALLKSGCAEVLLELGAVAERSGDRARAEQLYAAGVEALEKVPTEQRKVTDAQILEARLRLASFAKDEGDTSRLNQLVQEVLAHPSRGTRVCAPTPSNERKADACKAKPAEAVACQLLREAKAQGPKPRESAPDVK